MSRLTKDALKYAELGLKVFPLVGKVPVTPHGHLDGTTSEAIIKEWFDNHPEYTGIGAVIPEDVCIIDIDSKEAEKFLESLGLEMPDTVSHSGFRGVQRWYRLPATLLGSKIKRKVELFPKVDFLINGYTVLPPSKHPSGGEYKWVTVYQSADLLPELPEWLLPKDKEKINPDKLLDGVEEGNRQNSLFRYACQLRATGRTKKEASLLLREVANQSGSSDYNVDGLVERVWSRYEDTSKNGERVRSKGWKLSELAKTKFEQREFLIDQILPRGVCLVLGDPKAAKSLLSFQAALSIAIGKPFLNKYNTVVLSKLANPSVVVMDLEQSEDMAQLRSHLQSGGADTEIHNVEVFFEWERMDEDGLERLREYLNDNPNTDLVVIDTLADFWPAVEPKVGNAYHREQQIMLPLKNIAKEFNIGIMLIHHNRKMDGDVLQKASGTNAVVGKSDVIWSLERNIDTNEGTLTIIGKNVKYQKIKLFLDEQSLTWFERN